MENIYELTKVNSRYKSVIEALVPGDQESPLKKLAVIALSDNGLSDQECMIEIYGKKNITAFSRLKARFKEILQQVILLHNINTEDPENLFNIFLDNYRNTLSGRILISKRYQKAGIELIEKTINKSIKYNLTDNILILSRLLLIGYASSKFNKYKFTKYSEIQRKYLNIYGWEVKAENYYFDLQKYQLQALANPTQEMKNKAFKYYKELEQAKDIKSPMFVYNKYRVLAAYYEYSKNYSNLLSISDQAIKDFGLYGNISQGFIDTIYVRKIWALLQAGQSDQAKIFGKKTLTKLIPGSPEWLRVGYYTLKALLYLKEYASAIDFISQILNHPKFKKVSPYYIELYNTPLGYIHLIIDSGITAKNPELSQNVPEFKLGKYLNTMPVFSKDKRGINVSILLMHIAFLLQRKDYNAIIDRMDSLNQYAYRYLRKDDSFRSNCIIKMVIQMTKANFHPARTERYTADLRRQLSSVSLAGSGENIEIEIIPFEVLWDIMKKAL